MNAFTACPNGKFEDHQPHDFTYYAPSDREEPRPVIFCTRCGETRYLAVAPTETVPERVAVKARKGKR